MERETDRLGSSRDRAIDPTTLDSPHEKGKVERLHRTIAASFAATLPGYTGGPRDHRGRLEAPGSLLALGELVVASAAS